MFSDVVRAPPPYSTPWTFSDRASHVAVKFVPLTTTFQQVCL
jgi:hypothetical protein